MSADTEGRNKACCASCGIDEDDDIKLKDCSACHLVRYCGVECQRKHRPQHKKECKKRMAELRDEILFKQPESNHLGDCPICCLPLPLDPKKSNLQTCCIKLICNGCAYANQIREQEQNLKHTCPFCRHPLPKSQTEVDQRFMKRVEANNAVAIRQMGGKFYCNGDYKSAFEYSAKAAALGDIHAHFQLSNMYREGEGVKKDLKKELYHAEQAVIGGDTLARHNLGWAEWRHGRRDRAVKHWIIAAKLGYDLSLEELKDCYREGLVSKEDFAAALRAHQAAVDAVKSPQREKADAEWMTSYS
eukprot:scaffold1813_cov134-Skeletonema_dohrnii-CCMP3373.AAC.12